MLNGFGKGKFVQVFKVQLPAAFKGSRLRVQLPAAFNAVRPECSMLRVKGSIACGV